MALQKKFILTDSTGLSTAKTTYTQSIIFDKTRQEIWAPSKGENGLGELIRYSSYAYSMELGAKIDTLETTLSRTSYQLAVEGNPAGEGNAYITNEYNTTASGVTTYTLNVSGIVDAVGAVNAYALATGAALTTLASVSVESIEGDDYITATRGTGTKANTYTLAANTKLQSAITQVENWEGDKTKQGSIAYQIEESVSYTVAYIVAGADTSYDTLKEIADYIASDKTHAAEINTTLSQHTAAIEKLNGDVNTAGSVAKSIKDAIDALDTAEPVTGTNSGITVGVTETDGLVNTVTVTVAPADVTYNISTGALSYGEDGTKVVAASAIAEIVKYVDAKARQTGTITAVTKDATDDGVQVSVTTENGSVKTVGVTVTPGTFGASTASGVNEATAGLATVADVATAVNTYVNLAISSLDASGSYTGSYISYSYTEEDGKITNISVSVDGLVDEINTKELVTASALNNINSKIGADYDISKGTIKERLDEIESDIAAVDLSYTYVTTTDTNHIVITPASDGNDLTYTINANVTNLTVNSTRLTGTAGLADTADVASKVSSYVTNVVTSLGADITNTQGKDDKQFVTVGGTITEANGKITGATNTVDVNYGTLGVTENAGDAEPFTSTDGIAYVSDVASALNDYFSWGTV